MIFEDTHFMTDDQQHGWDGARNGKRMNPGVYLFWTEFKTAYGKVVTMTGDVTLIR